MNTEIRVAKTDEEIAGCHPVMVELRPHLPGHDFVALVRRLGQTTGFELVYLAEAGEIKSVAGYRISEWLAGGKYLEIEDLVSKDSERSRGHGGKLFDWLVSLAAQRGCRQLRLVSSVRRVDAHRFYLRKGMALEAHYFSLNINLV